MSQFCSDIRPYITSVWKHLRSLRVSAHFTNGKSLNRVNPAQISLETGAFLFGSTFIEWGF